MAFKERGERWGRQRERGRIKREGGGSVCVCV